MKHRNPSSISVRFVGAGPGDPDLLTLGALRAIEAADVVLHDRLISPDILALIPSTTRRVDVGKQGFGPHTPQDTINDRLVEEALAGHQVVRLKAGDTLLFARLDEEMDALDAHGIGFVVLPGITSAAAATATLQQSFTRRGRNASVRFLTGHDMKGFADHDWRALVKPGEVAAIYMGGRAARFIQGRLMMHGGHPNTTVTFVENASRVEERIVATNLGAMAQAYTDAAFEGPVMTLIGLAPRAARAVARRSVMPAETVKTH